MEVSPGDLKQAVFIKGVADLKKAGIENPAFDAAVLLGYVTGEPPATVLMDRDSPLAASEIELYGALVQKRCGRVAVSRLMGSREFYSREFHITDDELDPRPETEILVEQAIRCLEGLEGNPAVLDIGTGSGAIAVTVASEIHQARIAATDISMSALIIARRNAIRHLVQDRVSFLQTDLLEGIRVGGIRRDGGFHLILSNPPYISCAEFGDLQEEVRGGDPKVALVSGPEGTECYPPLVKRSMDLLCTDGSLMVEVGAGQSNIVADIFHHAGFADVEIVDDLAGIERVVKGNKKYA